MIYNKKYRKHAGFCHYCKRGMINGTRTAPTKDHVVPRKYGGGGGRNIVTACWTCNNLKGDMTPYEWNTVMQSREDFWRLQKETKYRGKHLYEMFFGTRKEMRLGEDKENG